MWIRIKTKFIIMFHIILTFIFIPSSLSTHDDFKKTPPEAFDQFHHVLNPNKFEYYTPSSPTTPTTNVSYQNQDKPGGQKTYFIIHDYDITFEGLEKARQLKDVILKEKSKQVNGVVIFDWRVINPDYRVSLVGLVNDIKDELQRLRQEQILEYKDVIFVGAGLGAQLAGSTAKAVHELGFTIGRIDGLDPTSFHLRDGRYLSWYKFSGGLAQGDADYVWILHTNTNRYGQIESTGDKDYFPNGGRLQPECERTLREDACSHAAAWDIYMDYLMGKELPNEVPKIPSVVELPIATILVLDVSPSMHEHSRLTNVISASSQFIKSYPLGHYFGMIQFGGIASVSASTTLMKDDAVRETMLKGLPKHGAKIQGTSIGAGLTVAVQQLTPLVDSKNISDCPQIILVTDGVDKTILRMSEIQQKIKAICAKVNVIALGSATTSKNLQKLIASSNGSIYTIGDDVRSEISDIILNKLRSFLNTQLSFDERLIRLPSKEIPIDRQTSVGFTIDKGAGRDTTFFVSTSLFGEVDVILVSPEGEVYPSFDKDRDSQGLSFNIPEANEGTWTLKVGFSQRRKKRSTNTNNANNNITKAYVTTFAFQKHDLFNARLPIRLNASLSNTTLANGAPVKITAQLLKGLDPIIGANVIATLVSQSSGQKLELNLFDTGLGAHDTFRDDGLYSRLISSLPEEGKWEISVKAWGGGCERPVGELDNLYLSAGEWSEVSQCNGVGFFERETEVDSLISIGSFTPAPPNQVQDLRVQHWKLQYKFVTFTCTSTGIPVPVENGQIVDYYQIFSATKYNIVSDNYTSFNDMPKVEFKNLFRNAQTQRVEDRGIKYDIKAIQVGEVINWWLDIPDELWKQNGRGDGGDSVFLFNIEFFCNDTSTGVITSSGPSNTAILWFPYDLGKPEPLPFFSRGSIEFWIAVIYGSLCICAVLGFVISALLSRCCGERFPRLHKYFECS